ncbi:putative transcriptional regulator [Sporomusaceae bacterium BoRhaA]|uniref:helix-turn-helix domain-containing protein n=1 Tax=Pelorhabdus rhamnosifermentans TaxID=2772457 RepID=UPI001C06132B|nr:helix-turn-helix transcriptional regulator [Pelorhabdus rhamnosifermentans]MBU2701662.1 putative transcriptional regulator [Pelorhabdus rhamnosifermentans]
MLAEVRNEAHLSQECAAAEAHVGRRSLSRYEVMPERANPQVILSLANVYHNSELIEWYCTDVCEIGKNKHCKIKANDLATAGLRWLKELQDVIAVKDSLITILCDGRIDSSEVATLKAIMKEIDEMEGAVHALRIKVNHEVDKLEHKKAACVGAQTALG